MTDNKIIYSMHRVGKIYPPSRQVLRDINLSYFYGAKIGLIGLNGSGKSTLLKIMAGIDQDFNGDVTIASGFTVGYLEQEPRLDTNKTVRQIVEEGVQELADLLAEFDRINEKFAEEMTPDAMDALITRQGEVQELLDQKGAWDLDARLDLAMDALRCPPADASIAVLSGGEQRRVALCRLLLREPDILLLDEPTNHLDNESVAWLEQHLKQYKGTVIFITHDRHFLNDVAEWILELERGHGIPWRGNYGSWLAQKDQKLAESDRQDNQRRKTLQRELEWMGQSPRARMAKSKSRIAAYEQMLEQGTEKAERDLELFVPPGPRLGNIVIRADSVAKGYGERLLYDDLSFDLPPGGIIGIVGPNGAGKTTLFRMITGSEHPDGGKLTLGETVRLGYVDQDRSLSPDKTVWEEISGGNEQMVFGNRSINSRAFVSRFNFNGTDQQKKVANLSGGERNRVHLAKVLTSGANVLLLDEPTNDLDVHTLRALEEALGNFAGCAVVISHDRWFLERVTTHILAFEGESHAFWFPGNYAEYEEDRRRRLGAAAQQPKRVAYRKLTRA